MNAHEYDPFRRVIGSGFVQVFRSIRADSYYTPIPNLADAESVIIVPLNYQDYTLGAIGVFGTESEPLNHNDLVIYELFAAQFIHDFTGLRANVVAQQNPSEELAAGTRVLYVCRPER